MRALPWGGGDIMEQPAYVVETVRLCERIAAEVQAKQAR
jgi:hypothetical protein